MGAEPSDDQRALWQAWIADGRKGDDPRRNQLLEPHLPAIEALARAMQRRLKGHESAEGLLGAAFEGLADAARRYDPAAGEFMAFARPRVRGCMLDHVRRTDTNRRCFRDRVKELDDHRRSMEAELGRRVSDAEAMESLGLSAKQRTRYEDARARVGRVLTLDMVSEGEGLSDLIEGSTPASDREIMQAAAFAELTRDLSFEDRVILWLRHVRGARLKDIGAALGVGESRACALHSRAATALRQAVSPEAAVEVLI